jgi:RimJ/RimL family protein N-acetyltransferase
MTATPRSVWAGSRTHLRAFTLADADVYSAWNQDSDQARAIWEIPWPRSPEGDRRWAEAESERGASGDNIRLVIADGTDQAIGDITTHDCDSRVGTFSYGVSIAAAHRRQGYAAEALGLLFRYMFEERRYQRAWVIIDGFNAASVALHEQMGFTQEGRLRRATYTQGEYHDQYVFGLLREEWEAHRAAADGSEYGPE